MYCAALFAAALTHATSIGAQPWVTADAAVADRHACRMQLRYGARASWALSACAPGDRVEVALGLLGVRDGRHGQAPGHAVPTGQLKVRLTPRRATAWGAAVAAGVGRDPGLVGQAEGLTTVYAQVPVSWALPGGRVALHHNVGWLRRRQAAHDRDGWTWATRADVGVARGLTAVGEVYGAEGAAASPAEAQVGLVATARSGRVRADAGYGWRARTGRRAAGWAFGLTLVTPPLF